MRRAGRLVQGGPLVRVGWGGILVALLAAPLLVLTWKPMSHGPATPHPTSTTLPSEAVAAVTVPPTREDPISPLLTSYFASAAALAPPGAEVSFAVALSSGDGAGHDAGSLVVSASAAKVYWTVAAVAARGVDAVAPYAPGIFATSDNIAAGAVIDLIGIDAVNAFLRERAGLVNTGLMQWLYEAERYSAEYPGPLAGENYSTVNDAVSFLVRLRRGELLAPAETAAVLGWMTLSPRSQGGVGDWGGVLGDRLPPHVQQSVMHKTGWITPGTIDDTTSAIIDIGIVPLAGGGWYAVALEAHGATGASALADYLSLVSCEIYVRISGEPVTCAAA